MLSSLGLLGKVGKARVETLAGKENSHGKGRRNAFALTGS